MSRKQRASLRREMARITANLDPRWLAAASSQVCVGLSQLIDETVDREIEHVLAFIPHFAGEVDLTQFVAKQLHKRHVYLPRVSPAFALEFVELGRSWADELVPGEIGIPEPRAGSGRVFNLDHASVTAAIVPGLVFDHEGNRISRDRGLYDAFAGKGPMLDALRIGVCWSLQVVKTVPAESHHLLVDYVCHERGVINTTRTFSEEL